MWDELLRNFRVARVAVAFEAAGRGSAPPFPGSALRGAFGRALRRAACATGYLRCDGCPLTARCAYGYLFETHVPGTATRMRRYPYAPHPFVLRPPPAAGAWREGERVELELVLFGRGIDYLPFVLYAFSEMGRDGVGPARVPLVLREARLLGPSPRVIYDGATLAPGPHGSPAGDHLTAPEAGDVLLSFVSPTRIVHGGGLSRDLPLHVVVRSLLRRVASLAYYHAGIDLGVDFAALVSRAEAAPVRRSDLSWVDQRRHSARQGGTHVLGGAVGEVGYADVPADLAGLLAVGELIHVGKGTAFGLGRFERRAA